MGLQDREWFNNPGTKEAKGDGPEKSPDVLDLKPSGGKEVRQLSKKPLLFVGGAVVVVGLVLVFTANQRAASQSSGGAQVAAATNPAAKAAQPEFTKEAPTSGLIGAGDGSGYPVGVPDLGSVPLDETGQPLLGQPAHGQTGYGQPGGPPPPQLVAQNAATGAPAYNRHATAWENYQQQRAGAMQARYETAQQALGAGSGVQVQQRPQQAQTTGGGQSVPGFGGASLGQPAQGGQGAGAGRRSEGDLNRQDDKRAFLTESGGRNPYAAGRVESAVSPYEIKAGSVIPATLITGVNSDLPGQLVAQVNRNVFDSATGRRLLIPQGSRLVGLYDSSVTSGQSRVLIAWNRVIFPDGSSIDLGSMPGADRAGQAGMRDQVNNHYGRTFGSAVFLSMFSAGIQLSQPQASVGEQQTAGQTISAQLGQQLGQLGMETARRNMQIQPTLTIRPGMNLNVQVTQDLILREWRSR